MGTAQQLLDAVRADLLQIDEDHMGTFQSVGDVHRGHEALRSRAIAVAASLPTVRERVSELETMQQPSSRRCARLPERQQHALNDSRAELASLEGELSEIATQMNQLRQQEVHMPTTPGERGASSSLGEAMSACGASFRVYFGGTIVGNHVTKLLDGHEIFFDTIHHALEGLYGSHVSQDFRTRHEPLWKLFAPLNRLIRRSGRLEEDEIRELELGCPAFVNKFRETYPNRTSSGATVTPKLYIVVVPHPSFCQKVGQCWSLWRGWD